MLASNKPVRKNSTQKFVISDGSLMNSGQESLQNNLTSRQSNITFPGSL